MAIDFKRDLEIKSLTSFKIGGLISRAYFPVNEEEFVHILEKEPDAVVLGNISNVLVSDNGYDGAVILTSKMSKILIDGTRVVVDCGVKGQKLAQEVAKLGLGGLEFMIGFPGAVGGEIYMNASANGQAISDNFVGARCYTNEKGVFELTKNEMLFGYRSSVCQKQNIKILSAEFELEQIGSEKVNARMQACLEFRRSHQPLLNLPNCGSIFKNPQNYSAGKLLEECGAKNFVQGGVRVWENHANFIVNDRQGGSLDVLELMAKMKLAVKEKFEIDLYPEIIYLGGNNKREVELCKMLYQKSQK